MVNLVLTLRLHVVRVVDTVTIEVDGWVQPTLGRIKTRTRVLDLGNRWGFPGTKFKNGTETVSSGSKLGVQNRWTTFNRVEFWQ
jgi:hypothetical protein